MNTMKIKKQAIRKFKNVQVFTPVLVVSLLVVVGAVIYNFNARAANAGFYFAAEQASYKVGETISVGIFENSETSCTNVVETTFTYPADLLRYEGFSATGSKFEATAPSDSVSGKASIVQYTTQRGCGSGATATSGFSGVQLLGTVRFTVMKAGNAALNFADSTTAISAADNTTNTAPGSSGTSYVLTAAPVTIPIPKPNPVPAPVKKPNVPKVTSITPVDTNTQIPLVDNDVVEITTPIEVQPLPVQPDGIERIEYYLSGKLVQTVKTPPYTYKLDTTKYLNGDYTLTTKTFYSNGQTKSVSQKLEVRNPFGVAQVKLWIQKFAWLVILILMVIGAAVVALIIHRRGNGPDNYYGAGSNDSAGEYTVSTGSYVAPAEEPNVYHPAPPK